jgi:hypothetical protein
MLSEDRIAHRRGAHEREPWLFNPRKTGTPRLGDLGQTRYSDSYKPKTVVFEDAVALLQRPTEIHILDWAIRPLKWLFSR